MANQFAVWDKTSPIITIEGLEIPAQVWLDQHPAAKRDDFVVVCSSSIANGSFIGELSRMVVDYTPQIDFSSATTPQEKVALINAFVDGEPEPATAPNPFDRIAEAIESRDDEKLGAIEDKLQSTIDMLTECILEMSEIIYGE